MIHVNCETAYLGVSISVTLLMEQSYMQCDLSIGKATMLLQVVSYTSYCMSLYGIVNSGITTVDTLEKCLFLRKRQ